MTLADATETLVSDMIATAKDAPRQIPSSVRRIVLMGFMGAGKSTIGPLLAKQLGWKFLDVDQHIEASMGLNVAEIFALHGEAHFRRLESSGIARALGQSATVIALGGGAPEALTNRLLLEQTPGTVVIHLDAPFPVLFDRCMLQTQARPVLADPPLAERRFAERRPLYRRLARHTIDTGNMEAGQAAEAICVALAGL